MASNRTNRGIAQLLKAVCAHPTDAQTDGQLLGQFLTQRDEAAFATLMRRHGPMVLGVCGRILGNTADAEDAFQATFLVLVRKANSLTARAVLGDWLHGVARRTALNARRVSARRRVKEEAMARPEAQHEEVPDDWLPCLDEELSRLPEKYRLPIVLCDLEGRTRGEVAARLGWPEGTVAGRLARGRALLAKQLVRRGLALSAASLAALLSQQAGSAAVPAALASSTLKAATLVAAGQTATASVISIPVATLVEGVLQSMFLTKLKIAAAVVLLVMALLGAGVAVSLLTYQLQAGQPATAPQPTKPKSDPKIAETPSREEQAKPLLQAKAPDTDDRIRPGDRLSIHVLGVEELAPSQAIFLVEPSGKVALGPAYGRVSIGGCTLEDAEARIQDHLTNFVPKKTRVSVTRPVPLSEGEGTDRELVRRVQQLEKEVRALRSALEDLRKKPHEER